MYSPCMRALLVVMAAAGVAGATPARTSTETLHPGIVHEHWADAAIPAELDLVRVDLTSAEIGLRATPETLKGKTTPSFASATDGAVVAIDGEAFAVAGYRPLGLAMGDGALWSQTADDDRTAVLGFAREGEQTIAQIAPPESVIGAANLIPATQGVVSGRPLLVRAGSVEPGFDCTDATAIACTRAPRSALGLTANGHTLLVVTVDGWADASAGMTAGELAAFLQARGADQAFLLDSGASSTLVLDGNVVNHPSDGVPAAAANHLAITYGAKTKGEMYGVICEGMLSNCTEVGHGGRITGATVTLDDGRALSSSTSGCPDMPACGSYDFTGITPRLACVTVKKTGYLTAHKCEQVMPGTIVYNSIVLVPGTDTDPPPPPDLTTPVFVDGSGSEGSGRDGALAPAGDGGCCGAASGASSGLFAIVLSLGWLRGRRSRYNAVTNS